MTTQPARDAVAERRSFTVPAGRMSYVDVGAGPPVVFVHGNPSHLGEFLPAISALRSTHRCLAIDHLGFGRSDKPAGWDYLPASHAANLAAWLDSLDLTEVTLVVGDWGGPIGLSWALEHPERVCRVVVTNSWMWPVNRSPYYQAFSRVMGGPVGRLLVLRRNAFAQDVVRAAWGRATPLTAQQHAEFTKVHPDPRERTGMWVFPREVVGSTPWLSSLWERRRILAAIPLTLVWGMRDIAMRRQELAVWTREFPHAEVRRLADVGHFPALEATDEVVAAVRAP